MELGRPLDRCHEAVSLYAVPHPPPPGVSIRKRSPAETSKVVEAGNVVAGCRTRTNTFLHGVPADPPSTP